MAPYPDEFWVILDAAGGSADSVRAALARLPIPRIARFHRALVERCNRACTWELWQAADIVFHPWGGATGDGFLWFRLWLVGQGQSTFARALVQADSLAVNPVIQRFAAGDHSNEAFPHLEDLLYAGDAAFDTVREKLGRGATNIERPDDLDLRPDENPLSTKPRQAADLPRLTHLFGQLNSSHRHM